MSLNTENPPDDIDHHLAIAKQQHYEPLRDCVRDALAHYLSHLNGADPSDLYRLVLDEVEPPLFRSVIDYAGGNQTRAATILGISRGTLRKKLAQYEIE